MVQLDNGQRVLVPTSVLVRQDDGSYYLAISQAELEQQYGSAVAGGNNTIVLPVIVEELEIQKRKVETGGVRVTKIVREREELVDEPLLREQVEVERVVLNKVVDSAVPVRREGDTLIIPVLEEVLVVEKRLILKEELHITMSRVATKEPQRVTLRSEEAVVERIDPQERRVGDGKDLA